MTTEQEARSGRAARGRGYRLAIAAIALITTLVSVIVVTHAMEPVYAIPPGVVVAVVVAVGASLAAAAAAVRSTRPDLAILSAAATFLLLLAVVGMLSIGILVLPFAVVAIVLTTTRASSAGRAGARGLVAGPVMAVALALVSLVAVQGPLVRCGRDGSVSTTTPLWWTGSSTHSGSSSAVAPDGTTAHRGEIRVGDRTARFECTDDTVTRFEVD